MRINKFKFFPFIAALGAAILVSCPESKGAEAESYQYRVDYQKFLNPAPDPDIKDTSYFKPYLDFLKEVYERMDAEYYLPISRDTYEKFADDFKGRVLARLKDKGTTVQEIKYLGAGLLVGRLKEPSDAFSNFFPPKVAEEYRSDVLGYELGIGITGNMVDIGYLIDRVELRSDSYEKGIRPGDIILKIDGRDVRAMSDEELKKALYPPLEAIVRLDVIFSKTREVSPVEVKVRKFFKETLSSVPTGIPGMFYVKINQFNRKTGEDLTRLVAYFMKKRMKRLVVDLRGNAGGPPLAAREIAGLFLPKEKDLFYFQRKNRPKAMLSVPVSSIRYDGKICIIIDRGSGSASELFAGTLRRYERAILIGERSAGKTYLKSMYHLEDKSMLVLVTSLAYLYNGEVYDPKGLKPDFTVTENIDLFGFISQCFDSYYGG